MGHLNSFFGDGDTIDYRNRRSRPARKTKRHRPRCAVSRMLRWRQTNGCVRGHGRLQL